MASMPRQVRLARRWVTLASGISGVVLAHVVAYVLAFSDAHQRALVLHETGHGYFSIAPWIAAGAGTVALARVAIRAASAPDGQRSWSIVPGWRPLALWQGALFLSVETTERLVARAPLSEMVHGHEVLLGLAVQLLLAGAVVVALRLTERLSARIAVALRRRPRRVGATIPLRPAQLGVPRPLRRTATQSRAPPPGLLPIIV